MEKFIHRENLALYRKRLEEPHTVAEREVLLKLLAEEEKKLVAEEEKKEAPRERQLGSAIGQAQKGTDAPTGGHEIRKRR